MSAQLAHIPIFPLPLTVSLRAQTARTTYVPPPAPPAQVFQPPPPPPSYAPSYPIPVDQYGAPAPSTANPSPLADRLDAYQEPTPSKKAKKEKGKKYVSGSSLRSHRVLRPGTRKPRRPRMERKTSSHPPTTSPLPLQTPKLWRSGRRGSLDPLHQAAIATALPPDRPPGRRG